MSKAGFYRIALKQHKVHAPRRRPASEPISVTYPRRRPLSLRRIALAKMPELK